MVNKNRVRKVNVMPEKEGAVWYWMNREMRIEDNWALLYAQEKAREKSAPLCVVYSLVKGYLGGGERQFTFKLHALQDIEKECERLSIPFFLLVSDSMEQSEKDLQHFFDDKEPGIVVTDFSPVRAQMSWVKALGKSLPVSLYMVDAHNIVPTWITSEKQEFAAYTIRPKLYRLLPEYLEPFLKLEKQSGQVPSASPVDWQNLFSFQEGNESDPVKLFPPGKNGAEKVLKQFLEERLLGYGNDRNDALANGQSDLSPYFHYGILAPQRVALQTLEKIQVGIEKVIDARKNKAKVIEGELNLIDHAGAFLEEMIIRRELSDNFCFYNKNYDSFDGFPEWAKKALDRERETKREYMYTKEQFEQAKTHDALWNAAQKEMVESGKMHGYMRMYWAKKILEWTESPEEAMNIAIYLNDKYSLDGRDPNGYAGIAWSIGGVHDRAWFPRPVYGTVRYMAESGAKKNFDTKAYIAKWLSKE